MLFLLHYTENSHSALSPFCTLDDPFLVDKIIFHPTFTLNILFNLEICFITKIEWVMCAVSCWPHQRKEKTDWPSLQTGLRVVKVEKAIQKYSMKKWKKKKKNSQWWHISEWGQEVHMPTLCLDTSDLTNRRHYSPKLHPSMTMDGHPEIIIIIFY